MAQKYEYFNVTQPQRWVAHVEINRPRKLNAFIEPMWQELRVVFDALSDDSSVRAVVFSGAGEKAFSAGLDVQEASQPGSMFNPRPEEVQDAARRAFHVRKWALEFQDCISSVERCEKPIICVLHGLSLGISIDIASCADTRICTTDATFSVKEVDIGIASDIGSLVRLPKIVGSYAWVKEVSLTARHFGAEEALRVGFVTDVSPTKGDAMKKAFAMAELMASKSPLAVQGTKNFLDWARDHDIATGLKYMAVWNGSAVNTRDVPLALEAARDRKKTPTFEKL